MKNKFHEQNVQELGNYLTKIKADYHRFQDRSIDGDDRIKDQMFDDFCEGLSYTVGRNYIKISAGHSTHSFIVAKPTKGFKEGDILMAKSWKAPATNFARGNIFEDYTIRWTGAL
tara:strand:- start:23 stop:367 length:345 start_codon:yes stop_codon:yes gene_type:complete